jgi:hypothetical protein
VTEAKRVHEEKRREFLYYAESWSFPPSDWEEKLTEELKNTTYIQVLIAPETTLQNMNVQPNRCHDNVRRFLENKSDMNFKAVTGWLIEGNNYVFHSVLDLGEQLVCITPSANGSTSIKFIPDESIKWNGQVGIRSGQPIGVGVRLNPKFEIALNEMIINRLLSDIDPYVAIEISSAEKEKLMQEYYQ